MSGALSNGIEKMEAVARRWSLHEYLSETQLKVEQKENGQLPELRVLGSFRAFETFLITVLYNVFNFTPVEIF